MCQSTHVSEKTKLELPTTIEAFVGSYANEVGLPFRLKEYLELVDWSGRLLREDKRGSIPSDIPPILKRLEFNPQMWSILSTEFETKFSHWVGSEALVKKAYQDRHYQRIPKAKNCANLLS